MYYLLVEPRMPDAYLYEYAKTVYNDGVLRVIEIDGSEYLAKYQLGRIQSGLHALSHEISSSIEAALNTLDAQWIVEQAQKGRR